MFEYTIDKNVSNIIKKKSEFYFFIYLMKELKFWI